MIDKVLEKSDSANNAIFASGGSSNSNHYYYESGESQEESLEERKPKSPSVRELSKWMKSLGLSHLTSKLQQQNITSKTQITPQNVEKFDFLSIAEKDALVRMLQQNKKQSRKMSDSFENDSDSQTSNTAFRRPLCKSYLGNSCSNGIKCKFLHSRPCKFTESGKKCPFGAQCPYLHQDDKGYASARERPCRFIAAGQKCNLGDKCQYLHAINGWRIEADQQIDGETSDPNWHNASPRDDSDSYISETESSIFNSVEGEGKRERRKQRAH